MQTTSSAHIPATPLSFLDLGSVPSSGAERDVYIAYNRVIVTKINEIGIDCRITPGAVDFLPGAKISDGALLVDTEVALPATILHEAAHLALMTPSRRREAGSDINNIYFRMRQDARDAGWYHRDNRYSALLVAGEDSAACALAWAWGKAWDLPEEITLYSHGGYGRSNESLRHALHDGTFAGVRFLEQAQIVVPGRFPLLRKMAQDIDPRAKDPAASKVHALRLVQPLR